MGNPVNRNLMTKAAFARLCNVSKPAVAKWLAQGNAVSVDGLIDVAATAEVMTRYRRLGVPDGLAAWLAGDVVADDSPEDSDQPAENEPQKVPGRVKMRREHVIARIRAMDWKVPFDADVDSLWRRAHAAASVAGFELVESDLKDDGHWGGYQLRSVAVMESVGHLTEGAVVAGFGFELQDSEVLWECRDAIDNAFADPDDLLSVNLAFLPALAYPFGPFHRPPGVQGAAAGVSDPPLEQVVSSDSLPRSLQ